MCIFVIDQQRQPRVVYVNHTEIKINNKLIGTSRFRGLITVQFRRLSVLDITNCFSCSFRLRTRENTNTLHLPQKKTIKHISDNKETGNPRSSFQILRKVKCENIFKSCILKVLCKSTLLSNT